MEAQKAGTADDRSDEDFISGALAGDRADLEALVRRHQGWIYNVAFRMVMDHDEAADITQEILIKVLTHLSSYDLKRAAFRTWVYRITANHVIFMKKGRFESRFSDIGSYLSMIDAIPDSHADAHPDTGLILEDIRISCMTGMLICLSRTERLVFILGGIFEVTDAEGSEILGITRSNFRKILSRSREKVSSFMNGRCGHCNPDAPCRCSNKMNAFLSSGRINPASPAFASSGPSIRDELAAKIADFKEQYHDPFFELFRRDPFYAPAGMEQWLKGTIDTAGFKDIFNIH